MTILLTAVLLCWMLGFAVLWRMPVCSDSSPGAVCRFAIIIPARNEADNLPVLLQSIAGQAAQPTQIIVVDDHSTDRTADIARQFGATVVSPDEPPQGWCGKTWACHQGALAANADPLLFLDADTRLEPEGLGKIVSTYLSSPDAVISVSPYHDVPLAYEQLSAFFNLIMTAGIGAFNIWPLKTDGLFGQMLMVSREGYQRVGGHERVKRQLPENFVLARHFRECGIPVKCFFGKGTLAVRMYPAGVGSLIQGWTKGFASGAKATSPVVLFMVIAWLSGAVTACTLYARVPWFIAFAIYAIYVLQIFVLLRRIGSFRFYTAVLFPIPLFFFFAIFGRSVVRSRSSVTWKGRVIRAD